MALPNKFRPHTPSITVSAEAAPTESLILTSQPKIPIGWLYSANGRLCAAIEAYTLQPGGITFSVIPDSVHPVLKAQQLSHAIFVFQIRTARTGQAITEPEATLYRVRPGHFLADGRLRVIKPPLIKVRGQDSTLFAPLTIPTGTSVPQPRR